jgi:hypothetical protein
MKGIPVERCWLCGADIFWAVGDSTGWPVPIDVEPVADGDVLLSISSRERRVSQKVEGKVVRVGPGVPVVHIVREGEEVPADRKRRVSHLDTCSRMRKRKGDRRR